MYGGRYPHVSSFGLVSEVQAIPLEFLQIKLIKQVFHFPLSSFHFHILFLTYTLGALFTFTLEHPRSIV